MKKSHLFLSLVACLATMAGHAKETNVSPGTLAQEFEQAADQDVLLLESGTYSGQLTFPNGKTVTLKAAPGAEVTFAATFRSGDATATGGGIILEGMDITTGNNYFMDLTYGDITTIAVHDCTVSDIDRCFLRTNNTGSTIGSIEFTDCIITDCGDNGWNFLYPQHTVKAVTVRNSTLKNYVGGESLFSPRSENTDEPLAFTFENNTVYKWSKSSSYALCNAGDKFGAASTYTFQNNIITEPGVEGQKPMVVSAKGGNLVARNNLVVNYGGYSVSDAASSTIDDLSSDALGITQIFPDPDGGDFTITSTSPLATASTTGGIIGDPRWLKTFAQPATLTTLSLPAEGGSVAPASGIYEKGTQVTVTATAAYGYRFEAWQDKDGQVVSADNPYTFTINGDTELQAAFALQTLHTLTINKEGDGAKWGEYSISPQRDACKYEAGEEVTISVVPNSVTQFLYWGDGNGESKRTVIMDKDYSFSMHYDVIPFIVGWDFDPAKNASRGGRPGDYCFKTDNTGVMNFYEGDGSSTSWGASVRTFGGKTLNCARRYTGYEVMGNPRSFVAKFSAAGYENIRIHSLVAADNNCVHKGQKMQLSTDGVEFTDLATITLQGTSSEWLTFEATLPAELTEEQKKTIYIRWIGDASTELIGEAKQGYTEGFYLADVFVYADEVRVDDHDAPVLLSSSPAQGSSNASANGNIVLTFNEKVQAGTGGDVTLDGTALTPVFGSKTASFAYSGLSYGSQHEVVIPHGAITDMSGNPYAGITITFGTMERPRPNAKTFDAVVAADGTGDYTTVQAAIDAAPEGRSNPYLIFVKNGVYNGLVRIPEEKPFIHLIGQDRDRTIIQYKINCGGTPGTGDPAWDYSCNNPEYHPLRDNGTVALVYSSDFYSENISYINTWGTEENNGPMALAMLTKNDRHAFYHCNFRSFQDTWQTSTRNISDRLYAKECYIEGAVDYIYGGGDCLFENCDLYNVRETGSVIVAPSHEEGTKFGYVFESCTIDGVVDDKDALGRPWHNSPIAVYLNTTMKRKPGALGWNTMGAIPKLFAEYNSMDADGNPIDLSNRRTEYSYKDGDNTVTGSCRATITAEEAAKMNYDNIIPGSDNWNPRKFFEPIAAPEDVTKNGSTLSWKASDYAICYVVLQNDSVVGITTECTAPVDATQDADVFTVKAVNEYGSLGKAATAHDGPTGIDEVAKQDSRAGLVAIGGKGSIELIAHEGVAVTVCTTAGQVVRSAWLSKGTHSMNNLQPGLYLANGQKVIVK